MAHAAAGPPEDYQRGRAAYQRGDLVTAMGALRPAAAAGHAGAQSLLGYIYEHSGFIAESTRLWQLAAAQGDVEANVGLANAYLTGRGVAKDETLALQHFSKAAAQGHVATIEILATAWINGQLGLNAKAEPAAALAAVRRAADQAHLPSADALALAYRDGLYGLTPDAAQAAAWQARATAWRKQRAATPPSGAPASRPAP